MPETKNNNSSGIGKYTLTASIKEKFSSVFADDDIEISGRIVHSSLLLEGIHFNLVYTPLKHLAYKSVMSALSGIYGQGGMPETIIVNLGLSSKFKQGDIEDLFEGYAEACRRYKLKISDLNIDSSLTGLAISVTAGGSATGGLPFLQKANHNDLICVTGDLGAAYMGLQILEREWKVFEESKGAQPMLEGYEYIIGRQLKPELRKELPGLLAEKDITITSLSVINEGLASSLIGLCKKSDTGCRIYQDKIPVSNETGEAGSELGIEPIISALNGGDDYEFVFTVPVSEHDKIDGMKGIRIIGHITPPGDGHNLVLQDGNFAEIKAQGWS